MWPTPYRQQGQGKISRSESDFSNTEQSSFLHGTSKLSEIKPDHDGNYLKSLKDQEKTQANSAQYTCHKCKKQFSVKSNLNRHLKIHMRSRLYECTECDKNFSKKKSLVAHLRTHLGTIRFQCTECDKCFDGKKPFLNHMRTHSGERPFQCTECEKSFRKSGALTVHLRTHSGERPYLCTECKKRFIQKAHLTKHLRMHLGDKPYNCTKCRKCFVQKIHLIKHQKVHTLREKPCQFSTHEQTFSVLSDFNKRQTPSVERPSQCNECKKSVRQLNDHVRLHRTYKGEPMYKCTECEKIFAENSHHIIQQRKYSGETNGKRHTVMARLLEVSVTNEYFILQHENYNKVQILENAIREKLNVKLKQ